MVVDGEMRSRAEPEVDDGKSEIDLARQRPGETERDSAAERD